MNTWIIEPRDPLIVRDGRPFGATPGARAASLSFPFPSTTAGAVRTREGLGLDGRFQQSQIPRVKKITVRGPFLVELDPTTGDLVEWFSHAPADALLVNTEPVEMERALLSNLVPRELPIQASTNLPDNLLLVGMPKSGLQKPCDRAPRYWKWRQFEEWLLNPRERVVTLSELGQNGPVTETRMHVRIERETQTVAEEAALFQTRGLEFTRKDIRTRLGLAIVTDAENLQPGFAPLGGERRLVVWRPSKCSLPSVPLELCENILRQRHCRLVLLTPAYFFAGLQPSGLANQRDGVTASVRAIAIDKPQIVSGWDLETNRPKNTRRLAPAGAVLFLKLDGDDASIQKWIDATWMQCVSDEEQDRRDGFGLAVLGSWEGNVQPMEVGS